MWKFRVMFCRLDTRNKTLPSICIIKQFWEIVPCLPYSNNFFFYFSMFWKLFLRILALFQCEHNSTGWDRYMLIIVIEIIFIMNKFLLVSRRARWFIFRKIHCKRNVSVLYQVSATTSKKCFKQNTQVESETWKPRNGTHTKGLFHLLWLWTHFAAAFMNFYKQTCEWVPFWPTQSTDEHIFLTNTILFLMIHNKSNSTNFLLRNYFFCFERRLKWPILKS